MKDQEAPGISRRNFIERCVWFGTAAALTPFPLGAGPTKDDSDDRPDWVDRPMRWAQLTLVENDPGSFDLQFWLEYFRRVHADAACLSAGGCVAYYPTVIPLHHRSAWLGQRDPFGDLVRGCRAMNMVVIARTDPHSVRQEVFEAHPEWIAVDAQGRKRRHWATPTRWVTCALGPYNFEFMNEVHREIVGRYEVDAIFVNRWAGSGMCYCRHCQEDFRRATRLELPRTKELEDERWQRYRRWRQQRLFELWRHWDSQIREVRPAARCIPNTGGGALSDLDMKTVGELADTLMADRQARRGLMPPWAAGKNAKEYRAAMGRKPIVGIFSVGLEEPYRWKDSVQSDAEIRIWVADGVANGLRPWFTKFSGTLHDRRWLQVVENLYSWHHQVERYLRNEEPLARVALVYSQQTAWYYGGTRARQRVEEHALGMYHALIEARIPFEMVHDQLLDLDRIRKFKTLVLPNVACLSERQCEQLRGYVSAGGSLVATFETSLYDERGARRKDFALADLFGTHFGGRVDERQQNSYLRLEKDPKTQRFHPLLRGLEDAPRIINGVKRVHTTSPSGDIRPPLTLIPSYPDLPMEEVYPRSVKTDIPQVYLREHGESRTVYFPWDIDRSFWEVLCVDHGKLLHNAVEWATHEELPATVIGPGVLDVTVWRQTHSLTVHLVNLTNPMMMKGPFRRLTPVGEQNVTVRLPPGTKASAVHLLVRGTSPAVNEAAGEVRLTVPSVLDHEVVAVDLERSTHDS